MSVHTKTIEVAAITHRGMVRASNQDALGIDDTLFVGDQNNPYLCLLNASESHVFMIADGMGGHAAGALASRTAIQILLSDRNSLFDIASCASAIEVANNSLYDLMYQQPDTAGLGTTIVGAAIRNGKVCYFNVGDSRLYRYEEGYLQILTCDDGLAGNTETGKRRSHLITQALGGQMVRTRINPHVGVYRAGGQETLLLCSDGLTDMLADDEIGTILTETHAPMSSVAKLLERALTAGGRDNISIIIARTS